MIEKGREIMIEFNKVECRQIRDNGYLIGLAYYSWGQWTVFQLIVPKDKPFEFETTFGLIGMVPELDKENLARLPWAIQLGDFAPDLPTPDRGQKGQSA